jgi:hypothetical protein
MLFDGSEEFQLITSEGQAATYIVEIELPCSNNMALCCLKIGNYDHVLFYTNAVLDKDKTNFKALYRRGIAYCRLGETKRA